MLLLEGENGAGKSTLFKILAGIVKVDAYEHILLDNSVPYKSTLYRSRVSYLGHTPAFYPDLSALENLRFVVSIYRAEKSETDIRDLLSKTKLDRRRDDPVRSFSRGMIQRLALCSAFLHDASVYLLDEPFTALDRNSEECIRQLILSKRDLGESFIITTHDPEKAAAVATERAVLDRGTIRER